MSNGNNAIAAAMEKKRLAGLAEAQELAPDTEDKQSLGLTTQEHITDAPPAVQLAEGERAYLMPSAPCSFVLSNGSRLAASDGVIRTSDEEEIKQLEAAVKCGNISRFEGQVHSTKQIAPDIQ